MLYRLLGSALNIKRLPTDSDSDQSRRARKEARGKVSRTEDIVGEAGGKWGQ
jgi:hypothetical protein